MIVCETAVTCAGVEYRHSAGRISDDAEAVIRVRGNVFDIVDRRRQDALNAWYAAAI